MPVYPQLIELKKMKKQELFDKCLELENELYMKQSSSDNCYKLVIKKLKEENKKLKQENQKLLDDIELHPDYEDTIESTIETAQKENEKLKDEVKDKQKWLDEWHKMMRNCDKANDFPFGIQDEEFNPEKLDDMAHLPAHIKKLKEENKKLKEELDWIFSECTVLRNGNSQ